MRDLRVTLVQSMLPWEDASAALKLFSDRLEGLKGTTDLVVLPEMFTTGFSMRSDVLSETMNGPAVRWMVDMAAAIGAAIYGSLIIKDGDAYYNRGIFVHPDGRIDHYDKRHLFRMAGEHEHFSPGRKRVILEYLGWRILPQVCYDLRFPVFSRNRNDHHLALYVANWPEARRSAWNILLPARAIENQCYVIGVNRVGMDGKEIHYAGDSVAVDPRGAVISSCGSGREAIKTLTLDAGELLRYREKFPAWMDADDFEIEI
jgi:omega-amidase